MRDPDAPVIALRADAGPRTGSGHVMRLRALALALASRDEATVLLTRSTPPTTAGFGEVRRLAGTGSEPIDPEVERPAADQLRDADAVRAALASTVPAAMVVDHYGLGAVWETEVREKHRARILAIDDLPRDHHVDVLVDPNLGAPVDRPRLLESGAVLRGPAYALLSPEHLTVVAATGRDEERRPRVLVALGGGRTGVLPRLVAALRDEPTLAGAGLDVLATDPSERTVVERLLSGRPQTIVHGRVPSTAALLRRTDLAIGAGGSMAWERLRAGVPAVMVALAPNQVRTCRALSEERLAVWVENSDDPGAVAAAAGLALSDTSLRDRVNSVGPLLVDGRGAERVALALRPPRQEPTLRLASIDDAAAVLAMSNDPVSRQYSRVTESLDPSQHREWLEHALLDPDQLILVATVDSLPVGIVRFRRRGTGDPWEISFVLDAAARGNSWAPGLVRRGVAMARRSRRIAEIVAVAAISNSRSIAVLSRVGFIPWTDHDRLQPGIEAPPGFRVLRLPSSARVDET